MLPVLAALAAALVWAGARARRRHGDPEAGDGADGPQPDEDEIRLEEASLEQ
jgi:hypothetical protein